MSCQPATCGKRSSSCCRNQEQAKPETGTPTPTEQTVTGQDLDETSTFTATATATGFASKEVDAKDQAQPEVSTKEDHSLEAETGCELEEKNLSHEMLTEVEGAYTTGDGEYDDKDISVVPGPTDRGLELAAPEAGKEVDEPKKGCSCDH